MHMAEVGMACQVLQGQAQPPGQGSVVRVEKCDHLGLAGLDAAVAGGGHPLAVAMDQLPALCGPVAAELADQSIAAVLAAVIHHHQFEACVPFANQGRQQRRQPAGGITHGHHHRHTGSGGRHRRPIQRISALCRMAATITRIVDFICHAPPAAEPFNGLLHRLLHGRDADAAEQRQRRSLPRHLPHHQLCHRCPPPPNNQATPLTRWLIAITRWRSR